MKKHERALNCFENVYRSNRNHLDALFHTGVELAHLDRHEKAITVFDKVLTKFGRNISVVYAMARSKAAINEVEESLSLLKEAAKQSVTNNYNRQIDPEEITTSFALMYQSLCLGVYLFVFGKWSLILSDITSIL